MEDKNKYPLMYFLKQLNIDEKKFIDFAFKNVLGIDDDDYIKYIVNKSKIDSKRYKYIRGHNEYHDKIYNDLWNLKKKIVKDDKDIYYKEIKEYHDFNEKEYIGCHIWGFTRNPFLYNSLWNVWYVPRFYSYLTDSDYGGDLGKKFRNKLKKYIIREFKDQIIEYNKYMIKNSSKYSEKIRNAYSMDKTKKRSLNYVSKQLVLINLTDREKDYLQILDDNFEVIDEIKNIKNLKMKDYT